MGAAELMMNAGNEMKESAWNGKAYYKTGFIF